ncbi:hypothetical protein HWV62_201 [Athelia sp. TMB]|nr:hypothetical protein HWV62_201 [Athelia sp. TMB]
MNAGTDIETEQEANYDTLVQRSIVVVDVNRIWEGILSPIASFGDGHPTSHPGETLLLPNGPVEPGWAQLRYQHNERCTRGDPMCCVTNRDGINSVLTNVGSHFAIESLQYVNAMVGELFVQPITMDHEGKQALIFPFAVSGVCLYEKCLSPILFSTCLRLKNLAIKMEGSFIPRYRVFDLFSPSKGQEGHAAMVCCYGSQFRVHSTKDFPGGSVRPLT